MMIILNGFIFNYVRSSTRRIHPHMTNTNTNDNNAQHPRISRREIALLRQMIFMFMMFFIGWTPIYLIVIITQYIYFHPLIFLYSVVSGEVHLFLININLFYCNHQVKEYLINIIHH